AVSLAFSAAFWQLARANTATNMNNTFFILFKVFSFVPPVGPSQVALIHKMVKCAGQILRFAL
ncbi:MAG: hypothetical protein Q4B68_09770, partial [Bacteroidales bacterium]|nr:hypothetical protein [Bacteroidales bacterium]